MKRLTILAIIACLGLLFAPSAVISNPPGPPGVDVTVLNTPLPVTGDMTGTISGEVEVTNNEANPVSVLVQNQNVSAKQPLYINLGVMTHTSTTGNFSLYESRDKYTVPDGYRLVIEQVFLKMYVPPDTDGVSGSIRVDVWVEGGGHYADHLPFLFTDQGLNFEGDKILFASQCMKLYIYPKEGHLEKKVSFHVRVAGPTLSGIHGDNPVLCGYLEELP